MHSNLYVYLGNSWFHRIAFRVTYIYFGQMMIEMGCWLLLVERVCAFRCSQSTHSTIDISKCNQSKWRKACIYLSNACFVVNQGKFGKKKNMAIIIERNSSDRKIHINSLAKRARITESNQPKYEHGQMNNGKRNRNRTEYSSRTASASFNYSPDFIKKNEYFVVLLRYLWLTG